MLAIFACFNPSSFLKVGDHGRRPHQFPPLLSFTCMPDTLRFWWPSPVFDIVQPASSMFSTSSYPPIRPWSTDVARFCALTMCTKYFSLCLHHTYSSFWIHLRIRSYERTNNITCWFYVSSSWYGATFCMPSSLVLLTSFCLLPSMSMYRNHTLLLARPGLPRVSSISLYSGIFTGWMPFLMLTRLSLKLILSKYLH